MFETSLISQQINESPRDVLIIELSIRGAGVRSVEDTVSRFELIKRNTLSLRVTHREYL